METPRILNIDNSCTGCGACSSACPKKCLHLEQDAEGFYYPTIIEGCVGCKLCEKVCHVLNTEHKSPITKDRVYTYSSSRDEIREKSSSGGAFTLFANYVLKRGGIVYSTLFNPQNQRVEISNTDLFPLELFRKSKYVESFSGDTCRSVFNELKAGRYVLFCGTPCQVSGLSHFLSVLKADSSKLLTIDFICHGTPSAKCFKSFLNRNSRIVNNVDFRYKDFSRKDQGWHDMVYCEYYSDGTKRVLTSRDLYYYYYYMPFLDNVSLRKSCYFCNEVNVSSADITVGDFWSIHKNKSIADDNKGVSIVKIHSQKAAELWDKLKIEGEYGTVSFELIESQLTNKNIGYFDKRKAFFDEVKSKGYIQTVRHRYFKKYLKNTIKRYGYCIKSCFFGK